jgi:hypothetical protein
VITASGQIGPDVGKVRLRFGDASSGNTDQLQWPVHPLSTILNPFEDSGRLPRQKCRDLIGVPRERRTATQRRASDFPPPVPFPQASISPTHAAPQHNKTHSDQRLKPWWKNRPTLKVWRESPDSETKARPFRPRTIKVSGEKPANTREFQSPPRAESMFA